MSIVRNSWSFVAASNEKRNYTKDEALAMADKNDLTDEVEYLLNQGFSPTEALSVCGLL